MIIFLDSDGSIVSSQTGNVGKGSSVAWIYAIAPIAAATASISFELPTGDYTEDFIMTLNSAVTNNQTSELPEGVLNSWAPNGTINYWACKLDKSITGYSGTVKYTIRFTFPSGDVLTSSGGSFEVARGVPSSLPNAPSDSVYSQILTALSSVLAANEENALNISDLRTKLEALGVRVTILETGEGNGDSGDGTQRGVAIYATTSFPDATITPDVEEGDLCICVYQAATGIYQYNNADGWRYFVGLGDGRVIVNNYAPSYLYQLQNGDVWIDTSTKTLYYSDGSSISSVSLGSPISRYSDINPSTFDWGTFIGTSPWFSAPNQGVGLFTFASGCAPTFDGAAYNGSLFMVVNADYTKGIYFTTFMNGKTYVASYPAVSNTISVPAALAFSAASGSGGISYTPVDSFLTFDWIAAMCAALGVDSLRTSTTYTECGQLFIVFGEHTAYLPDNNLLIHAVLDFTVVYLGQGSYELTLIVNYKGKPAICTGRYELQVDNSYAWDFNTGGRPYASFSYVT